MRVRLEFERIVGNMSVNEVVEMEDEAITPGLGYHHMAQSLLDLAYRQMKTQLNERRELHEPTPDVDPNLKCPNPGCGGHNIINVAEADNPDARLCNDCGCGFSVDDDGE